MAEPVPLVDKGTLSLLAPSLMTESTILCATAVPQRVMRRWRMSVRVAAELVSGPQPAVGQNTSWGNLAARSAPEIHSLVMTFSPEVTGGMLTMTCSILKEVICQHPILMILFKALTAVNGRDNFHSNSMKSTILMNLTHIGLQGPNGRLEIHRSSQVLIKLTAIVVKNMSQRKTVEDPMRGVQ